MCVCVCVVVVDDVQDHALTNAMPAEFAETALVSVKIHSVVRSAAHRFLIVTRLEMENAIVP